MNQARSDCGTPCATTCKTKCRSGSGRRVPCIPWVLAALLFAFLTPARAEWRPRPAEPGETIGVYVSNGDNELLYTSPPVESPAAIDDFLDIIHEVYGAKILFWRGGEIEQIVAHCVRRPASRSHGEWIEWLEHLTHEVGTTAHAVAGAHKRGMEVWGVAALLNHGGGAHVDAGKGYGPLIIESKLRVEHPEWVPIDRYGIRRMSGPICLAYPEARAALVTMFVDIAVKAGYDGLMFHTYSEQFHARFDDEFGFNEPVVRDYARRFGVDIFANDRPYDVHALAHLRGEYLTALFRELRAALGERGIKLGLMLDSVTPHYPQRWGVSDLRVTGRIIADWQRYVDEALVDWLWVNYNGPQHETVNRVLGHVERAQRPCGIIMMHSDRYPPEYQHFRRRGVARVLPSAYKHFHWGYLEPQPAAALDGDDFIAKLSVLHQMSAGQTPFEIDRAIKATRDPHLYVRRMAVALLGEKGKGNAAARAAAEACLHDPENGVRTYAVNALVRIGDASSIDRVYAMLADPARSTYMLKNVAVPWSLQTLPDERTPDLLRGLCSEHEVVRAATLEACRAGVLRPGVVESAIRLTSDASFDLRWRAARVLGRFPALQEAKEALFRLLDDPHAVVRSMAAVQLGSSHRTHTRWVGPAHLRLVRKLIGMFSRYGDQCQDDDAQWGWRCIGDALMSLGPRGEAALRRFLAQDADKALAARAWDVLHVKLSAYKFVKITPKEAHQGYRQHPRVRTGVPGPPALVSEPAMMPYLIHDLETDLKPSGPSKIIGDSRHETGKWHTFSKDYPDLRIRGTKRGDANTRYARVIRGQGLLECSRSDYLPTSGRARVQVDLLRESGDSDLGVLFTAPANRWRGSTLQVRLDSKGVVQFMDSKRRWHATPTQVPVGQWVTLVMDVDLDDRRYSISMDSGAEAVHCGDVAPFACEHPLGALIFYPNGTEDNRTGVDNVRVTVSNPAHGLPRAGTAQR